MKRTLAQATLLGVLPFAVSVGQVNPNWPQSYVNQYAYTYSSSGESSVENLAYCANPIVSSHSGPTRNDPSTSSGSCSFSGDLQSTLYQYDGTTQTTTPSTLNAGTFTTSASATADPGANHWAASASMTGTVAQGVNAYSYASGYDWEYITVSDPAAIYKIVLSASNAISASGAGSNAQAALEGYTVNPFGNYLETYEGEAYSQVSNGFSSSGQCSPTLCTSVPAAGNLSLELGGSVLNSNGVFAALMDTYTQVYASGGSVNGTAQADASGLTVTLYEKDAAGNLFDATGLHTITYDPNVVTATPEPATLGLMGTGILSVLGVAHRRRRKIAA